MHDHEDITMDNDLLIEAAREAGRAEARRILTDTAALLERQAELRGSMDHPGVPFDAYAVLGALRAALGG
jgi:hypothetical protein